MGRVTKVRSLGELRRKLERDLKAKERALVEAQGRAALLHADYIRQHMPVAFGELRASVHVEGTRVVVDARHAAAVERGSRPHWVPLEAILKWVKLRGFQGLAREDSLQRLPGNTTFGAARGVAASLREHNDATGYSDLGLGASDVDGPLAVAKRIQVSIARNGTKPHWFMRDSVPAAQRFMRAEVSKSLREG